MAKKRGIPKADLYQNYQHTLTVPIDNVEPLLEALSKIRALTDSPEIQAIIEKALSDWTYKT